MTFIAPRRGSESKGTIGAARGLRVVVGLAVMALLAGFVAPLSASAARHRYSVTVRTHVTKTVRAAVRTTVAATASATAGSPPVTARVTVRVTNTGRALATRTAWVSVHRTAPTRKKARRAARAIARARAAHRAERYARSVARTRALRAARTSAQAQATAAARAAAMRKARELAAQRPAAATGPGSACTALPKAGGGTWTCTFDEEFNGTSLDPAKWMPITTSQNGYAGGQACLVNSPDNIKVSGGTLNLTVRRVAKPFVCQSPKGSFSTSYTGGQVATYGKFAQTYGRFSVRAKFPAAVVSGLQSTLWLWPQNNVATGLTGEIDIAEWYSVLPDRAIPYLHYAYDKTTTDLATNTNVVTNNYCKVADVNAFHEYTAEWTPKTISIYIDGRACVVDNLLPAGTSPFDQPYFVALTACLGIGPNPFQPGVTPLPATTQVDWVRVWK